MIFRKSGREVVWASEVVALSWDYRAARLVEVAHGVGLFACLAAGPATAETLAGALRLAPQMTENVLIALAALGLVRRDGDGWALTAKAEATLVPDAPLYQGNTLAHSAQVWSFWSDLELALRGGQGGWVFSPTGRAGMRSHRDFILAMHNMAMAGRGAELADRVDLAGRHRLMDVGGGPGSYAMALCERYPDLTATVIDLPETIEIARDVIGRLGMADRVRTVVGNWDEDEFGTDNDVALLSNILHGPASGTGMKLAKAHRSLVDGGLLIVQDFLMNAGKTGPIIPALFNVMVGAFSVTEMTDRIDEAGFTGLEIKPMPDDVGTTIVTATKQ